MASSSKKTRNTKKKPAATPEEVEIVLNVLSNDPQGWKYDVLQMLYTGAVNNQLGYMDALNTDTGEVDRLLVGLEPEADGKFSAYPLARFLEAEELKRYLAPDGLGGFDGLQPTTPVEEILYSTQ